MLIQFLTSSDIKLISLIAKRLPPSLSLPPEHPTKITIKRSWKSQRR